MYPYASAESGDLAFDAGETIVVIKKDGEWWRGRIGDREGDFPSNYVKLKEMQPPELPPKTGSRKNGKFLFSGKSLKELVNAAPTEFCLM